MKAFPVLFKPVSIDTGIDIATVPDVKVWLKYNTGLYSDAGVTPSVDTGVVQRWVNQVDAANHGVSSGSERPTLQAGMVRFDGSDDVMALSLVAQFPRTIFLAVKTLTLANVVRVLGTTGSNSVFVRMANNDYAYFNDEAVTVLPIGGVATGMTLITLQFTSDAVGLAYCNGAAPVTSNPNPAAGTATSIGLAAQQSVGGGNTNCEIGEFVVVDRACGAPERLTIEQAIAARVPGIVLP